MSLNTKSKKQIFTETLNMKKRELAHFVKAARIVEDDKGHELRDMIAQRHQWADLAMKTLSPMSEHLAIEYASAQAVAGELKILLESLVAPDKRIEQIEKEIGELNDRLAKLDKQGEGRDEF